MFPPFSIIDVSSGFSVFEVLGLVAKKPRAAAGGLQSGAGPGGTRKDGAGGTARALKHVTGRIASPV